jgi:hypothetical protein
MKNFKLILTSVVFASLVSCVNSDDYDTPNLSNECVSIAKTKEVSEITSLATSTATQYTTSNSVVDYIEAYVTSSDEGGNFYKSISMTSIDGLTGFSMPVDNYNLYNEFEPGRKVTIKLDKNRFFNRQHSSTVIGSSFNNGVGRVSGVQYKNVILRSCNKVNEDAIVKNLSIDVAKNDQYLNQLIEFDAVQFTDASAGKKYYDASLNSLGGATNHLITDVLGNTIIVRVSEFAKFAGEATPNKSGKIRGVLTKFNNDYQFMVRTLNDVKLTNDRIVLEPIFEETFTSNWNNWIKQSVSGGQVWTLSTTFGNPGSCALMSGFASNTNNVNEDWLISPAISLTNINVALLRFENASRFSGNLLEVYVSTNYNSGLPSTATWTQITGFTLDTNTSSYSWTNSGGKDISTYIGNTNFRVAFKYTSTSSASRTWQIDNVRIIGQ